MEMMIVVIGLYVTAGLFVILVPVIIIVQLGAILSTLKKISRQLPPEGQNRP
jgi:hypothetical protein